MRPVYFIAAGVVPILSAAAAPAVEWRSTYEDSFDSSQLNGDIYRVQNGTAALVDGCLRLEGENAFLLVNVAIPRDVRVEFDAMVAPGSPVGGLGCVLHAGSGFHYTFMFGADGNGVHRLTGEGLNLNDEKPSLRVQPGKWVRLSCHREGKQITCRADDAVILDGAVDKVVGTEGIQRIALVAEHGMLVDNLRIRARVPSHPDCCPPPLPWLPLTRKGASVSIVEGFAADGLQEAVDALNAKRFDEARKRFEAIDDPVIRLTGLAFILGDLDYEESPVYGDLVNRREKQAYSESEVDEYFGEFGRFALRWDAEMRKHPDNEILKAYRPYIEHVGRLSLNRWAGARHAEAIESLDSRINPFAHKAGLYLARFTYWNGMEGGNEPVKNQARARMKGLLRHYPDNPILREYVGEPVPWGEELNADAEKHPAWAAYLREAYARELAVIQRLCEQRQRPDGQFGGGYGDDVEMLRRIVPIVAISTCSEAARAGIQRLTEGVWKYDCVDGYNPDVSDVEHSSEQSADSFPTMMLLRYGDPRYVEFNLRSAKTIREKFMGIDARGYPRFLSGTFGSGGVATHDRAGGDTGYHARAMKHFLWLSWYGNEEARDWYVRWLDGWRAAAVADAPDKPAGVLPGTLWYPSGGWQHPWNGKPWYLEDPSHLYGAWGLGGMLQESFLAAYAFTGDDRFLKPAQLLMDWASLGPLHRDNEHDRLQPGTRDWFRLPMAHGARAGVTALYRHLTGERVYDEYTMRFGTPPQVYPINHDLDRYMTDIEKAAKSLRHNLRYYTTETLSTDRLHLPAVESVWGAYTGAVTTTGDCELQTFAVTYDTPDADFAALVVDSTPRRLRVWLYSFRAEPTPITLHVWQLQPGEYILNRGEKVKGEFPFQNRYKWIDPQRVTILHRAEGVPVTVPSATEYVVDLRLDRAVNVPGRACDLAVSPRDVSIQGNRVSLVLHNIGSAGAFGFDVTLQQYVQSEWRDIAAQTVAELSHPVDLAPFTKAVDFDVPGFDLNGRYRFVVDPEDRLFEICETNNTVEVPPEAPPPPVSRPLVEEHGRPHLPAELQLNLGGDLKIELVLINPGEFLMGLRMDEPRAGAYERPPHRVRIDKPFYLGRYEITQAQWECVSGRNPSHFTGAGDLPVEMVTWEMADEFCRRLSSRVRRGVRLPSEAEWEYACRAGATAYWSHGDDVDRFAEYAWYGRNAEGKTHPVGQKKPNAWGLHDMHGNVREWCGDWFGPYPGTRAPSDEFLPRQRILRGGSWDWIEPENQGASRRDRALPTQRMDHYGLRIVVDAADSSG